MCYMVLLAEKLLVIFEALNVLIPEARCERRFISSVGSNTNISFLKALKIFSLPSKSGYKLSILSDF